MFFENAIKNTLANRQLSDVNIMYFKMASVLPIFFFIETIIGDYTPFLTVKTIFFCLCFNNNYCKTYIVHNAN